MIYRKIFASRDAELLCLYHYHLPIQFNLLLISIINPFPALSFDKYKNKEPESSSLFV